jgi:hypothetical protein
LKELDLVFEIFQLVSETHDEMMGGFELLLESEVLAFKLFVFGGDVKMKLIGFIEHVLFGYAININFKISNYFLSDPYFSCDLLK